MLSPVFAHLWWTGDEKWHKMVASGKKCYIKSNAYRRIHTQHRRQEQGLFAIKI